MCLCVSASNVRFCLWVLSHTQVPFPGHDVRCFPSSAGGAFPGSLFPAWDPAVSEDVSTQLADLAHGLPSTACRTKPDRALVRRAVEEVVNGAAPPKDPGLAQVFYSPQPSFRRTSDVWQCVWWGVAHVLG